MLLGIRSSSRASRCFTLSQLVELSIERNLIMKKTSTKPKPQKPEGYLENITEAYDMVKQVLLSGDKELIDKTWKFLNDAPGDWVWVRAKLITDCYEAADAEGKEEFCQLALQEHVDRGDALPLALLFTDEEMGIDYQEFLMADGTIYRIPIVTDGMSKYTFQKALNKMFVGDFIKTHSVDEVTYTLLDTQEKVDSYNEGTYYDKYVYKRESRRKSKISSTVTKKL